MPQLSIYEIVKSPLLTEKITQLQAENKYAFAVDIRSNKIQIRKAIEKIYKVKVKGVNIVNVRGKKKQLRMGQTGKTPDWKKAIVTLVEGQEIKLV
jgi:large subunit ribosomal protein L23